MTVVWIEITFFMIAVMQEKEPQSLIEVTISDMTCFDHHRPCVDVKILCLDSVGLLFLFQNKVHQRYFLTFVEKNDLVL